MGIWVKSLKKSLHHLLFLVRRPAKTLKMTWKLRNALRRFLYTDKILSRKLASASWSLLALASIPGAAQGHHVIFHAKGPPRPLPHIYHCYISYIIYHCCILVGTNNAATRWWQSLRNSPLPFLLSPTPLAFVIQPRPQVRSSLAGPSMTSLWDFLGVLAWKILIKIL